MNDCFHQPPIPIPSQFLTSSLSTQYGFLTCAVTTTILNTCSNNFQGNLRRACHFSMGFMKKNLESLEKLLLDHLFIDFLILSLTSTFMSLFTHSSTQSLIILLVPLTDILLGFLSSVFTCHSHHPPLPFFYLCSSSLLHMALVIQF